MSRFRDRLETRINEETLDRVTTFVESQNSDPHWNGAQRGYLAAIKDVLTWSQEIEKDLNNG